MPRRGGGEPGADAAAEGPGGSGRLGPTPGRACPHHRGRGRHRHRRGTREAHDPLPERGAGFLLHRGARLSRHRQVPRPDRERPPPRGACSAARGGARADAGSMLLLERLDRSVSAGETTAGSAIDLGCGNGLLTAYLAAALPEAQVLGSDDDAEAVASTRATLEASGLTRDAVRVTWDHSLAREETGSADLVLLNPPFHDGTVIDATLVQELLDAAARVLRPRGQLWFVHNSHLRYRPEVEARI